jgi:SynChlorMet cassette protein ScmC
MIDPKEEVGISLENGLRLRFLPGDKPTSLVLFRLTKIMQLRPVQDPTHDIIFVSDSQSQYLNCRREGAVEKIEGLENITSQSDLWEIFPIDQGKIIICALDNQFNDMPFFSQICIFLSIISFFAKSRGGLQIHGALAERENVGVVFAGFSGRGKSTAVNRLPPSWQPLCDECTLVVPDEKGGYWAHPMPTCSRFKENGSGGTWNFQHSVPLKGLFILLKSDLDQVCPVNMAEAIYLTDISARQMMRRYMHKMSLKKQSAFSLSVFDNSRALAKAVPVYVLKLSLAGEFWNKIESAIN